MTQQEAYRFRWLPPNSLEGGRTYPRWSLLGITTREVTRDDDGWLVTWGWKPWREDGLGNPQPHPEYRPGQPGPVPKHLRAGLGV